MNTYCNVIKNYVINSLKNVELPEEIKNIYLIGSTAKLKCNSESDIDILIEFNSLDIDDIRNSALFSQNISIIGKLLFYINEILGDNPLTGNKFELQLVGAYELRFFPIEEIEDIMKIKIKLNNRFANIINLVNLKNSICQNAHHVSISGSSISSI